MLTNWFRTSTALIVRSHAKFLRSRSIQAFSAKQIIKTDPIDSNPENLFEKYSRLGDVEALKSHILNVDTEKSSVTQQLQQSIATMGNMGLWSSISDLTDFALDQNLLDEEASRSLMNLMTQSPSPEDAVAMIMKMAKARMLPDSVTLAAISSSILAAENLELMLLFIDGLVENRLAPPQAVFHAALVLCRKKSMPDLALQILLSMEKEIGQKMTQFAYDLVVTSFRSCDGNLKKSHGILDIFDRMNKRKLKMHASQVALALECGDIDEALKNIREVHFRLDSLSDNTYCNIMELLADANRYDDIDAMILDMMSTKFSQKFLVTWSLVLKLWRRIGASRQRLDGVFLDSLRWGVEPWVLNFKDLVGLTGRGQLPHDSHIIGQLDLLNDKGAFQTLPTLAAAVDMLMEAGDYDRAIKVFDRNAASAIEDTDRFLVKVSTENSTGNVTGYEPIVSSDSPSISTHWSSTDGKKSVVLLTDEAVRYLWTRMLADLSLVAEWNSKGPECEETILRFFDSDSCRVANYTKKFMAMIRQTNNRRRCESNGFSKFAGKACKMIMNPPKQYGLPWTMHVNLAMHLCSLRDRPDYIIQMFNSVAIGDKKERRKVIPNLRTYMLLLDALQLQRKFRGIKLLAADVVNDLPTDASGISLHQRMKLFPYVEMIVYEALQIIGDEVRVEMSRCDTNSDYPVPAYVPSHRHRRQNLESLVREANHLVAGCSRAGCTLSASHLMSLISACLEAVLPPLTSSYPSRSIETTLSESVSNRTNYSYSIGEKRGRDDQHQERQLFFLENAYDFFAAFKPSVRDFDNRVVETFFTTVIALNGRFDGEGASKSIIFRGRKLLVSLWHLAPERFANCCLKPSHVLPLIHTLAHVGNENRLRDVISMFELTVRNNDSLSLYALGDVRIWNIYLCAIEEAQRVGGNESESIAVANRALYSSSYRGTLLKFSFVISLLGRLLSSPSLEVQALSVNMLEYLAIDLIHFSSQRDLAQNRTEDVESVLALLQYVSEYCTVDVDRTKAAVDAVTIALTVHYPTQRA